MKPLHKNTGKWSWGWKFGRFFFDATIAEDPSTPLLLRTWAFDEPTHPLAPKAKQLRRTQLFGMVRLDVKLLDGRDFTIWRLFIGFLSIAVSRLR